MRTLLFVLLFFITIPMYSQFGDPSLINHSHAMGPVGRIVCVDYDYDGDNDLICSSFTGNLLVFYENIQGDSLKNQIVITNNAFFSIDTADVDGDNLVDLLAQNEQGIGWYRNVGDNTFSDFNQIVEGVGCAYANDIDQDGDVDVVVAFNEIGKISLFKNNGGGVFDVENVINSEVDHPMYIQFEDMDNDGDTDFVASSNHDYQFDLYENDGNESFVKTPVYSSQYTFSTFKHPKLLDFNNDDLTDIIYMFCGYNNFINVGGGNFSGPQPGYSEYTMGSDGIIGDVNNDGAWDYATQTMFSPESLLIHVSGLSDQEFFYEEFESMSSLVFSDFDNDGFIDIIEGFTDGKIVWYKNDGIGVFLDPVALKSENSLPYSTFFVDYDSDGDVDVFCAYDDKLSMYENSENNAFEEESILLELTNFSRAPINGLVDIDNDGDFDFISITPESILIYQQNGSEWIQSTAGVADIELSAVEDMNGDGFVDIVYSKSNEIFLVLNDGAGGYTSDELIISADQYLFDLGIVDLDQDGDLDVVTYSGSYDLFWFVNTDGEFAESHLILSSNSSSGLNSLSFLDINEDGNLDIIFKEAFKIFQVLITSGPEFETEVIHNNLITQESIKSIGVADLDMDGDGDIVYSDQSSVYWIERFFDYYGSPVVINDDYINRLDLIDLDGDEVVDLVSCFVIANQLLWQKNYMKGFNISGDLFFDANQNGLKDVDEDGLTNVQLDVSPNALATYADSEGVYWMAVDPGEYELSFMPIDYWGLTTPYEVYSLDIDINSTDADTCDFGFYPEEVIDCHIPDLISGPSVCDSYGMYWIQVSNAGTTNPAGIIELELDDAMHYNSAQIVEDSISNGKIYWSFDSINFLSDTSFYVIVETPPATMFGDTLISYLDVCLTDELGAIQSIFSDTLVEQLTCAYDPNDKSVFPVGTGDEGFIDPDQELEYTIRFQNTGNDTAINVIIVDPLDSKFESSSFEFISSSHDVRILKEDNMLTFSFDSIMLPDSNVNYYASNGYIKYRMLPVEGLNPFEQISNTGYIYFDYNNPILTNTVYSTINCWITPDVPIITFFAGQLTTNASGNLQWYLDGQVLDGETSSSIIADISGAYSVEASNEFGCSAMSEPFDFFVGIDTHKVNEMYLYPNPANNELSIHCESKMLYVEVIDILGQVVFSQKVMSDNVKINVGSFHSGSYFVKVYTEQQSLLKKLIVE